MSQQKKVLFVCLGNICRSTMAEGAFKHIIEQRNLAQTWSADSCGTGGWHVGCGPDERTMQVLSKHGVKYEHEARQITKEDFTTFDYIFGMDKQNLKDLKNRAPQNATALIDLLGNHHPDGACIIQDPYYDRDLSGFETVYDQCVKSINAFLDKHSQ